MSNRKNVTEAKALGARLTELRAEMHGEPGLSYDGMVRDIVQRTGFWFRSREQIRRYHDGEIDPERASLDELVALAAYYRVPLGDLSPAAAERADTLVIMLKDIPPQRRGVPRRKPRGLRNPGSGCTPASRPDGLLNARPISVALS